MGLQCVTACSGRRFVVILVWGGGEGGEGSVLLVFVVVVVAVDDVVGVGAGGGGGGVHKNWPNMFPFFVVHRCLLNPLTRFLNMY